MKCCDTKDAKVKSIGTQQHCEVCVPSKGTCDSVATIAPPTHLVEVDVDVLVELDVDVLVELDVDVDVDVLVLVDV